MLCKRQDIVTLLRIFSHRRPSAPLPVHRFVPGAGTLPVGVQGRSALLAEGEIPEPIYPH